jgi:ribonuclease-3
MTRLGHQFTDPSLLRLALVHRSWQSEHDEPESNERLEFLGDAVVGFVVADAAYRRLPTDPEGRLSDLRQAVVNTHALAERARAIGVGEFLLLGHGESIGGGRDKDSILADAFEAIIGAVYLDGGTDVAREFVRRQLDESMEIALPVLDSVDAKTALQELCASRGLSHPAYETEGEGPDHERVFTASVEVDGKVVGTGTGRTKKAAEQLAARAALFALGG